MTNSAERSSPASDRDGAAPLVLVALAMIAGIAFARVWSPTAWGMVASWCGAGLWLVCRRHGVDRAAAVCLLLAIAALAADYTHCRWRLFPADHLARLASSRGELICLDCEAVTGSRVRPGRWGDEQSHLDIRAVRVREGDRWLPVRGSGQLFVAGRIDCLSGDRLRVSGVLSLPSPPTNPGQFNWRDHLRSRRLLFRLQAPSAGNLAVRGKPRWCWRRGVDLLRRRAETALRRRLSPRTAALAEAILLGSRTRLPPQTRQQFVRAGAAHLLAVSGLHLSILIAAVFCAERLGASRLGVLLAAPPLALLYALLAESRPPVARAALLVLLLCGARCVGRRPHYLNCLAAAAIALLIVNPLHLFAAGAQLSFIAVAVLWRANQWLAPGRPADPLTRLLRRSRPLWRRAIDSGFSRITRAAAVAGMVTGATMPLAAYVYHVLAPTAVAASLLATPLIALALLSGLLTVAGDIVAGAAATPAAWICDTSIRAAERLLAGLADLGWSGWTVGPSGWWVTGFYIGLLAVLGLPGRRAPIAALAVWLGVGCCPPLASLGRERSLRVTIIDVGHGGATLVEFPGGRTLLCDAGRLGAGDSAAQTISRALWSQRIERLDALLITHADADHYNGVIRLAERFDIREIVAPPALLNNGSLQRSLVEPMRARGCRVRSGVRGDRLELDSRVVVRLLQPVDSAEYESDNAGSIVLCIEYAGQRVLLTGDIEGTGLESLLSLRASECALVTAPHHGSARSSPDEFLQWSAPNCVVAQCHHRRPLTELRAAAQRRGADVLMTAAGAVRLTVTSEGVATLATWRQEPQPHVLNSSRHRWRSRRLPERPNRVRAESRIPSRRE
ncbi:MAG: ComEC/Rec2 family competence protein [Pirellulaceae bacterium]|nr:ComEC/Rec2 family competence protein [Pirellulaceae bacterium]MDP7020172.1 ComEC/Rec2 family competence protein [Pirellulaceae bacterium]